MAWYVWLAFGAFFLKAYWCFVSKDYEWADSRWYWLMAAFLIHNGSEFLAYSDKIGIPLDSFFKSYYSITLWLLCAAYYFILNQDSVIQRKISLILLYGSALASAFICFSPLLINGNVENAYPIKAIKGEYFWVYLVFGVSSVLAILFTMAYNYRRAETAEHRISQIYLIQAFSPFLAVSAYIGGGMLLGLNVNASGLYPVASAIFMLVTINRRCTNTFLIDKDPRSKIPFTPEWRLNGGLNREAFQCSIGNQPLPATMDRMEGLMLKQYCAQHKGSKALLARRLGISRPTLDRKLEKHNIKYYRSL